MNEDTQDEWEILLSKTDQWERFLRDKMKEIYDIPLSSYYAWQDNNFKGHVEDYIEDAKIYDFQEEKKAKQKDKQ